MVKGLGLCSLTPHFQQYLSFIVVVSFVGGGIRSMRRKPSTCRKSLTYLSYKVVLSTPYHQRDSNSQLVICRLHIIVVNPTTIRSRPRQPLLYYESQVKETYDIDKYMYIHIPSIINVWTKYGENRIYGNGETVS